ncbi:MAG: methyltransferase [Nanoarchaeota archaeon]
MAHYYSEKQDSELNLREIEVRVKQKVFKMHTANGIFSKNRLDNGTKLLIEKAEIGEKNQVLDFGCGIGVVGIVVKSIYPETKVIMSDINERAVELSMKNVKKFNLDNQVIKSNLYDKIKTKFDTILVNPPQTAGKLVCFSIIEGAFSHLNKTGTLQLVARHKKGGQTLSKKMEEVFGNVMDLAKGSGYRIYLSKKTI